MTIETHESVVRLTLGSASTASGIAASIDAVAGDAEARVLLITGDWDGVCAELTTSAEADPITVLAAVPFPVVASISGACYEQALELALAADVRIASPTAAFRMAHITQGRMPTHGGTQRLTRTVGRAQTMRMLLTGDALSANDALGVGTPPSDRHGPGCRRTGKRHRPRSPHRRAICERGYRRCRRPPSAGGAAPGGRPQHPAAFHRRPGGGTAQFCRETPAEVPRAMTAFPTVVYEKRDGIRFRDAPPP